VTGRVELCLSSLTEGSISQSTLISVGYEILYTFTSGTAKEESCNTWQKKGESTSK